MRDRKQTTSSRAARIPALSPVAFHLLLVAIVCLAASLRFYRLDAQSFWNDEGNSARIAERSLDLILEGAAGDIHPPGYYLLLHTWRALFGHSEFALRSLSVVAGLALVVFTGLLGRWLVGPGVGLMASFLSAFSPLAIYYSQEARMYALLAALCAASTYVTFRALGALPAQPDVGRVSLPADRASRPFAMEGVTEDGRWASRDLSLIVYALVNAAGLYTHYAFVFVLVVHNVVFGLRWLVSSLRSELRWSGLARWVAAQLGTGLLYLPWLPPALNAAGWSSAGGGYDLGFALLDAGRVLAVGVTQSFGEARLAVVASVGLLMAGPWLRGRRQGGGGWRRSGWWPIASLVAYLVVPLGLFFGFDLYKPAWLKFLVVLLPSYHVLVARGISHIAALPSRVGGLLQRQQRIVHPAVCGLIIMTLAVLVYPSLRNLYVDPAYARDDYRQLAADIREVRRAGDAIVLNAPNQWEVFTYYYPDRNVYPAPYRPAPGKASSFLDPLLDKYQRIFVVYWGDAESDPRKRVESWLAEHAYKAGDRWYGDVRLATYGVAPLPREPDAALRALFGDRMFLRGYALVGDAFAPGEIVPLTLFWEALGAIDEPYKVSVQMLDDQGQLAAQIDSVPGDGLAPTTSWQTSEGLVDRCGVRVPGDAPPGRYSLIAVVYHAASGTRAPVTVDGEGHNDHLVLQDVMVRPGSGEP